MEEEEQVGHLSEQPEHVGQNSGPGEQIGQLSEQIGQLSDQIGQLSGHVGQPEEVTYVTGLLSSSSSSLEVTYITEIPKEVTYVTGKPEQVRYVTGQFSDQAGQGQVRQQEGQPGHVGVLWEALKKMTHIIF